MCIEQLYIFPAYHERRQKALFCYLKTLLSISFSDTKLQSGLVARYQLAENDEDQSMRSPDFPCENPLSEQLNDRVHLEASLASSFDPDFSSLSKIWHSSKFDSDELRQKVDFLKIQAQVSCCNIIYFWDHLVMVFTRKRFVKCKLQKCSIGHCSSIVEFCCHQK